MKTPRNDSILSRNSPHRIYIFTISSLFLRLFGCFLLLLRWVLLGCSDDPELLSSSHPPASASWVAWTQMFSTSCLSYLCCCNKTLWQDPFRGRKGIFWLATWGLGLSWWGHHSGRGVRSHGTHSLRVMNAQSTFSFLFSPGSWPMECYNPVRMVLSSISLIKTIKIPHPTTTSSSLVSLVTSKLAININLHPNFHSFHKHYFFPLIFFCFLLRGLMLFSC